MAKTLIPSYCKTLMLMPTSNKLFALSTLTSATGQCAFLSSSFSGAENVRGDVKKSFKKQHVNYSQATEAVSYRQQNTDSTSTRQLRKSDFSESRQRLTNIRFFYGDPEIDKAIEKQIIRLNPMTMMYMGVSNDNSHLFQSANYLRNELPIRLAHMIKILRQLPFIVACNPSMLEIHERCINTFHSFENFEKDIKDINTERSFNHLVFEMLEMNKDLLALLCDGFKDNRKYIKNESFIKTNLNKILSARLGIRLLCEHHIALNKQSNLNKMLLPDNDQYDNEQSSMPPNVDNYESKYVQTTNGDSNGSGGGRVASTNGSNNNWVGIINKKFSPKQLVETSGKLATRLCLDKYGVAPRLKIDGHTNAQFAYLPLPLEYIVPELLKNSFRATLEHHRGSMGALLPDVSVTIALNDKDFIIRIRDRGGGIPHSLEDKIFDYHFSTAEKSTDPINNNNNNNGSDFDNNLATGSSSPESASFDLMALDNSGMGLLCEASGSRGLAVMHGYGFGLPTSKAYAEYLGGSLTFQSMQGIGSDFYLRLGLLDIEHETVRI